MKYEECCRNCEHNELSSCNDCSLFAEDTYENFELRSELAKIENGAMIEPPCKIGDSIFWRNGIICSGKVSYINIEIDEDGVKGWVRAHCGNYSEDFYFNEFNKICFLSKEELLNAEKQEE